VIRVMHLCAGPTVELSCLYTNPLSGGSAPPSGSPHATPGLVTSTALFQRGGGMFAGMEQPKLFPRPSGDVYLVGYGHTHALPQCAVISCGYARPLTRWPIVCE
jgi:hypothetical protein